MNVKGKWALVTGASRGVGLHIATALAGLGCNVVLHSRRKEHAASLAASLKAKGVSVIVVAAELDDQNQVDAMLKDMLAHIPQIDILVNNAAIMAPYRENPWQTTAEDYRKSFEVNVISLARICNRLVPLMLERKWGRVVNVTSGIENQPELTAYAVSKAAIDKYVRDFAPMLSGSGVMMNLLDPGWLRTDMGGANAPHDPSSVIPGALVPILLNDGISGRLFRAQDYAGKSVSDALALQVTLQP
ncbi:MAG: SDR family oxidoreductase [Chromatiales bacterium]|nr:MAG: SDR family oxidoreductase [Chromatiales bacterium]